MVQRGQNAERECKQVLPFCAKKMNTVLRLRVPQLGVQRNGNGIRTRNTLGFRGVQDTDSSPAVAIEHGLEDFGLIGVVSGRREEVREIRVEGCSSEGGENSHLEVQGKAIREVRSERSREEGGKEPAK